MSNLELTGTCEGWTTSEYDEDRREWEELGHVRLWVALDDESARIPWGRVRVIWEDAEAEEGKQSKELQAALHVAALCWIMQRNLRRDTAEDEALRKRGLAQIEAILAAAGIRDQVAAMLPAETDEAEESR